MKKQIIINPQWQGGNDFITYSGAEELKQLYLSGIDFAEVPVYKNTKLQTEHGIIGFSDIKEQMESASALLKEHSADCIFAIGGGCDADIPIIAYLNERYCNNLLVIWCDAHGDMNAPEESETGLFFGMPVRILIEDNGLFSGTIRKPLTPDQIIQFGGRDFDSPEIAYMKANHIRYIPPEKPDSIWNTLKGNARRPIYIHLDLDVINPKEFPNTPLPVNGGVSQAFLLNMLRHVKQNYSLVGLGLYEYAPCNQKSDFINAVVQFMIEYHPNGTGSIS